jgi:hypothetical protein
MRRLWPVIGAWLIATATALVSAATALADGGSMFP